MASVSITPLGLTWAGGSASFEPARATFGALALRFTGGAVTLGPGTATSLSVTTPTLDRAVDSLPIGEVRNGKIHYTLKEQIRQQRVLEAIENAFAALTSQVTDNSTIIARVQAAQNLAAAANDNATDAVDTINITNSYTDPVNVLTAANTGVITIAAHDRVYGNGTSVSVDSGSVSGFSAGDYVTVYYTDAAREGGAVTYQGTTNAVAQTGNTHIVGQATIPAAGEPAVSGMGVTAPGYTAPSSPSGLLEYDNP